MTRFTVCYDVLPFKRKNVFGHREFCFAVFICVVRRKAVLFIFRFNVPRGVRINQDMRHYLSARLQGTDRKLFEGVFFCGNSRMEAIMKQILYLLTCIFFLLPSTAYAYLDPGTGNVIVYVVMSFLGAIAFSLKGIMYKLLDRNTGEHEKQNEHGSSLNGNIVIFSEGKAYWNTFKPVVESLLKAKTHFSYYTMDIHDPCLLIDNLCMDNRYIGNGNIAYAKIGTLTADIVLSTTPNIGTKGYPIPRSEKIKKLVHVFHAFDDLSSYHKGSLDHYDAVMLVGDFERPILRKLEAIRGLKEKELYPAGLPYLDVLAENKKDIVISEKKKGDKVTILAAPSWGSKGFLSVYGYEFLGKLAEAGYSIIVRPHPQSLKVEKEILDAAKSSLASYENITWDYATDGTTSLSSADIMISDTSMIRIDFLFLYQRPVITLAIPLENMQEFEIDDLGESWAEKAIAEMGYTVDKETIHNLPQIIQTVLHEVDAAKIIAFREKNVYHWGNSGKIIANYLASEGRKIADGGNNSGTL